MNLLRTWWAPIRARLIDDARMWWRMWSVWFAGALSVAAAMIIAMPDVVLGTLNQLPPEMRTWLSPSVSIAMFVLATLIRLWKQGGKRNG